ncbi:cytoskeletal protein RodZ [Murinocardiopsis flavida]|uniref:Cytoskeletal protein RodZ n=1 Tax=Murinocardiopsis flavida TaxID=645275 RepID=A0A2P8DUW2_9ACTN|nr:helix-turn-helix domain-containing protein [Murinocardiopsis flavida]PSL01006.1 cytoskeletal protein RodZ [Murinocardiopsis flavida]
MSTIGRTLAAIREQAGYTVAGLSGRTCIREQVLEAMEADDFAPCGGDFYARGHIRSLCRELGVDAAPLIERFDREHAGRPETAASPEELFAAAPQPGFEQAQRRKWPIFVAAALATAGILAAAHAWPKGGQEEHAGSEAVARGVSGSADERPQPPGGTGAAERREQERAAQQRREEAQREREKAQRAAEQITLRLSADQRTWVRVDSADGEDLFTGTLTPGQSRDVRGEKLLRLSLGNAGGVRLTVNGADHGPAGPKGKVTRVTVGPDGPTS